MTQNEIDDLLPKLHSLGYSNIRIWADTNLEQFMKIKNEIKASPDGIGTVNSLKQKLHPDYTVRINADGKGNFWCDGSEFDINTIDIRELRNKLLEIYSCEPISISRKLKNTIKNLPILGIALKKI